MGTHGGKWPPRPCDGWDWVTAAVSADKVVVEAPRRPLSRPVVSSSVGGPSAMTAVVWAGALLALLVPHRPVWREVLTSVSHSSLGLWAGWLGSLVGGITAALLG